MEMLNTEAIFSSHFSVWTVNSLGISTEYVTSHQIGLGPKPKIPILVKIELQSSYEFLEP